MNSSSIGFNALSVVAASEVVLSNSVQWWALNLYVAFESVKIIAKSRIFNGTSDTDLFEIQKGFSSIRLSREIGQRMRRLTEQIDSTGQFRRVEFEISRT